MKLREQAIELGIDPDAYTRDRHALGFTHADEVCRWCFQHPVRLPRLACDVEQERARLMRQEGKQAACCPFCQKAHEGPPRSTCSTCRDAQQDSDTGRRGTSLALRVDDGNGCVERASFAERLYYPEWFR
jgi:hypothetical protein